MILVLFEHLETLLLGLYFHDQMSICRYLHFEINILNILNIFTEIIGMAPPINVQDWYGDRHTCQIASDALGRMP